MRPVIAPRRVPLIPIALVLAVLIAPFSSTAGPSGDPIGPARHRFENLDPNAHYPMLQRAESFVHRAIVGFPPRGPALAVVHNDGAELRANGTIPTVTWVGHATFLIQLDGVNILTDPHWGASVGPFRVVGLRRLVPPGIAFEDLPRIDAVVISHDHYDHLDLGTVLHLERVYHPRFFVPLGLEGWLRAHGVRDVVELGWWEQRRFGRVTFISVPAQHTAGRGFGDQDTRLWCSWVIAAADRRLFFGGDTGYFRGFADVARRLGPFDLAALPIGGYASMDGHHPNHLNPEEAVQAFEDLHAHRLVPMHWGTFETNHEPTQEPPTRLVREATRRGIQREVDVLSPGQTIDW